MANATVINKVQIVRVSGKAESVSVIDKKQIVEASTGAKIVNASEKNQIVKVASAGLRGPAGADTRSFTAVAGESLGGHRAVYIDNNEAFYASASDTAIPGQVVGVTTQAAVTGGNVDIRFAGTLDESSWSFAPGPVYVGQDGVLVQTRPTTGWVLNIGVAVTPTRLLIHKTMTIEVS